MRIKLAMCWLNNFEKMRSTITTMPRFSATKPCWITLVFLSVFVTNRTHILFWDNVVREEMVEEETSSCYIDMALKKVMCSLDAPPLFLPARCEDVKTLTCKLTPAFFVFPPVFHSVSVSYLLAFCLMLSLTHSPSYTLDRLTFKRGPNYVQVQPQTLPDSRSAQEAITNAYTHANCSVWLAIKGLSHSHGSSVIILQWIISVFSLYSTKSMSSWEWH